MVARSDCRDRAATISSVKRVIFICYASFCCFFVCFCFIVGQLSDDVSKSIRNKIYTQQQQNCQFCNNIYDHVILIGAPLLNAKSISHSLAISPHFFFLIRIHFRCMICNVRYRNVITMNPTRWFFILLSLRPTDIVHNRNVKCTRDKSVNTTAAQIIFFLSLDLVKIPIGRNHMQPILQTEIEYFFFFYYSSLFNWFTVMFVRQKCMRATSNTSAIIKPPRSCDYKWHICFYKIYALSSNNNEWGIHYTYGYGERESNFFMRNVNVGCVVLMLCSYACIAWH